MDIINKKIKTRHRPVDDDTSSDSEILDEVYSEAAVPHCACPATPVVVLYWLLEARAERYALHARVWLPLLAVPRPALMVAADRLSIPDARSVAYCGGWGVRRRITPTSTNITASQKEETASQLLSRRTMASTKAVCERSPHL
ncbi:unnamed protein product [Spodoptera exigua]|nr:unnamed protein product [Spodoptera exigua]